MDLIYHAGDEYAPSFESDSLEVLTFVRLSKTEVNHKPTCYPWMVPKGCFPALSVNGQNVCGTDDILQYFASKGRDLDAALSAKDRALALAFKALVREKLQLSLLYLRWMESRNYAEFTRLWYANHLPFPLTLILPNWFHSAAEAKLSTSPLCVGYTSPCASQFIAEGLTCLEILAQQLGDKTFMFGSRPSSLDAAVFAQLCLIIQQPLPGNNSLWKQLHKHGNLVEYCNRIRREYFTELNQAPRLSESTDSGSPSIPAFNSPTTWTMLGIGAAFLGLQYWRYRNSLSPSSSSSSSSLPSLGLGNGTDDSNASALDDVDIS